MKKIAFLLVIFLGSSLLASAQNFKTKPAYFIISPPEKSLSPKETLEYEVTWLGFPMYKLILKNEGIVKFNQRDCYHFFARAFPNKFFARFYDLEYELHSYADVGTMLPYRFEKKRRLGEDTNYQVFDFDREKNTVKYKSEGKSGGIKFRGSRSKNKITTGVKATSALSRDSRDLLSGLYYLRVLKIKESNSYLMSVYFNYNNWPVVAQSGKPYLKEMRKRGSFEVVSIDFDTELSNSIFGKNKVRLDLTIDPKRIPVEFELGTSLGPIKGRLVNAGI